MLDPWKVKTRALAAGLGKLSDLADAAGVTIGALSAVLAYRRASVSAERLAVALGCSVADLESGAEEREANRVLFSAWVARGCPSVVVP